MTTNALFRNDGIRTHLASLQGSVNDLLQALATELDLPARKKMASAQPGMLSADQLSSRVTCLQDIADRLEQSTQAALAEREQLSRLVMQAAPIGIALLGVKELNFVIVNSALSKMLRYEPAELVTLMLPDIVQPADVKKLRESLATVTTEQHRIEVELRLLTKMNDSRMAHVTLVGIKEGKDTLANVLLFAEDITEQIHTREHAQRYHAFIEQEAERIDSLSGDIREVRMLMGANNARFLDLLRSLIGDVSAAVAQIFPSAATSPTRESGEWTARLFRLISELEQLVNDQ